MAKKRAGQAEFVLSLNDQLTKRFAGVASAIKAGVGRIAAAGAKLANFGRSLAMVGQKAALMAAAVSAAVLGAGRAFANYGDAIDKMSIRTDISREALQELKFAAEQSGTSIDSLSQALFRARRRIGNAAAGTGPAVRALEALGLSARELSTETPERQLEILAGALGKVGNEAVRNQLAFEIFGDNFRDIQPLLDAGVDSIQKLRQEARELGLVLSEDQIKEAAAVADAFNRAQSAIKIAALRLIADFGPALRGVLDNVAKFFSQIEVKFLEVKDAGQSAFEAIGEGAIKVLVAIESKFVSLVNGLGRVAGFAPVQGVGAAEFLKEYQKQIAANRRARQLGILGAELKRSAKLSVEPAGASLVKGTGLGGPTPPPPQLAGTSAQYFSGFTASIAGLLKPANAPMVNEQKKTNEKLDELIAQGGQEIIP